MEESQYIPALSYRWLTPVYDPLARWGMREKVFKERLIRRADIRTGQQVLDLGCGTGTLAVMLKRHAPGAEVTGLDADRQMLVIAESKARRAGVKIRWDHGMAHSLPYADRSFDAVLSSLVIHHLSREDKLRAFRDVRRVLKHDGSFHIVDFGEPFNGLARLQAGLLKKVEEVADNFEGQIVPLLREAGFGSPAQEKPMTTIFGPVWFYQAAKSSD